MATTASETKVQELYIAYFGRPADPAGLAFYADALDATSTTINDIAASFAVSTEAAATVALSTDAYLAAVYLQAFGRAYVEGTDGTFWKDAINNATTTKELAMVQILEGASGTDATAVTNKVTVAKTYTAAVTAGNKDYSGTTAAASAKAVLDGVTDDAATVTSGNTAAQTSVDSLSNASAGVGQTFALTTSAENIFGTAMDDTITGTADGANGGTFNSADVIADSSTVDNDTLTIASTAALTETATVVGIENVVINQTSFAAATANLSGFSASSVTINQLQAGAATTAALTNASGTVTFGSGITTTTTVGQTATSNLTVNAGSASGVAVTGGTTGALVVTGGASTVTASGVATTGSVTISGAALTSTTATGATTTTTVTTDSSTVNVTGTAATTDTATVSIGAAAGVVNTNVETLNISSGTSQTAASVATASGTAATTVNLSGSNDITYATTTAIATGQTVASTATGAALTSLTLGAAATADLTKIGTTIAVSGTANAAEILSVATGATVNVTADATADVAIAGVLATAASNVLNLGVASTQTAGVTITNTKTVNLDVTAASDLSDFQAGTANVIVTGSTTLALDNTSVAASLDATAYTGALTATAGAATIATITGGTGNDTITALTNEVTTVAGGTGTDTVIVGANATKTVFSGFEVVNSASTTVDFLASQVNGATFAVTGITDLHINNALALDSTTIDLSGMQSASLTDTVTDGSAVSANIALGTALTFTGTSVIDTVSFSTNSGNNVVSTGAGADVITTGAGNDTITAGEGTDAITAGAGVDTIILTETTAVSDTVTTTSGAAYSATNIDSITGFTAGTGGDNVEIDISDAILVTGTTDLVAGTGTVVAGTGVVEEQVVGAGGTIATGTDVTVLTGGVFADNAALIQAITSDGTDSASDLAWAVGGTQANADAFILVYSDGTDTHIVSVADAAAATNLTLEVADLTVTDLVTLSGITSIAAGDFVTANFDFV